jgi:acyl-CoA synthetase (AMP-forming)/AMP-acid ligase II
VSAVPREFSLRRVSEELRRRYLRDGLWTDDTLGALIDACVRARPGLAFRIWSERRPFASTLSDVHARARRLAAGLRARGVCPGDVVAFQLPNWAEAAVTFFGLSMLGVVIVPVVHFYGARELRFILRQSGARALITTDRFGRLDYAATLTTLRHELSDLQLVVMAAAEGGPAAAGAASFGELTAGPPIDGPATVPPDAPAVIAYTSGTTAEPKGVIHTHRTFLAEIRQLAAVQPGSDRPALFGAPVAHAIGMLGGLLLPLYRGHAIHLTDVWQPAAVLEAMRAADLTAGSGATVFLTSLLDAPGFTAADAARIGRVGLGGAPVPIAVAERAEALGIGVTRLYGATEHPSVTGSLPEAPREKRNRTDGCALAGVEIRLVGADGREVGPGEPGEIHSRGPDLCAGYTDPALTATAFDGEGWYATGDIGVVDADGYLTITDRKTDIIIRGGANISAAEIEELLAAMPGVAEVAVVAAPDARLGEHACAFVRPRPGAAPPDLGTVRRHLEAAGLARPKWPEDLRIVEDFPRTPTGKIRKVVLRDALRAEDATRRGG